jgi:hypothetical protein
LFQLLRRLKSGVDPDSIFDDSRHTLALLLAWNAMLRGGVFLALAPLVRMAHGVGMAGFALLRMQTRLSGRLPITRPKTRPTSSQSSSRSSSVFSVLAQNFEDVFWHWLEKVDDLRLPPEHSQVDHPLGN